jgi:Arc/MetJ-type ribon-helix-helix transcriptional regulator
MKTHQITLPDDFAAFVDKALADKQWDDADHLFLYALARVQEELAADADLDVAKLRAAIQVGIDQADRGETAPLDLDALFARLRAKLEAARGSVCYRAECLRDSPGLKAPPSV